MRELSAQLLRWHAQQASYAVATAVDVTGSAPRLPGATMAVNDEGAVLGSISGGCVEAAVYDLCGQVMRSGMPAWETFGYSDSDAFAVGLTCGGEVQVFVHRVTPQEYPAIEAVVRAEHPITLVRDLRTGEISAIGLRETAGAKFEPAVVQQALGMLDAAASGVQVIGCDDDHRTVFIQSFGSQPRLIVCGATDFSAALCQVGRLLGYRVTVCDARSVFTTKARFPDADEVVVDWPHRYLGRAQVDSRTAVCVLTHDPKFDIPVLQLALRLPIGYVGAMGSRRADADRRSRLRAAGLTEFELRRLHSPIGLELGGRTPEEIAVAIAAEIVAVRRGGSTRPLSATNRPIHAVSDAQPSSA